MFRIILSLVAAVALAVASLGSVAAEDGIWGPECFTPEYPSGYICRYIGLTLVPDADIEEVLARTVGEVERFENVGESIRAQGQEPIDESADRMWTVLLADGDDAVEAQEILLADPGVEDVGMGFYGELTGGQAGGQTGGQPGGTVSGGGADTLPDTAMSTTAPITLVGATLVLMGVALALRRRLA